MSTQNRLGKKAKNTGLVGPKFLFFQNLEGVKLKFAALNRAHDKNMHERKPEATMTPCNEDSVYISLHENYGSMTGSQPHEGLCMIFCRI